MPPTTSRERGLDPTYLRQRPSLADAQLARCTSDPMNGARSTVYNQPRYGESWRNDGPGAGIADRNEGVYSRHSTARRRLRARVFGKYWYGQSTTASDPCVPTYARHRTRAQPTVRNHMYRTGGTTQTLSCRARNLANAHIPHTTSRERGLQIGPDAPPVSTATRGCRARNWLRRTCDLTNSKMRSIDRARPTTLVRTSVTTQTAHTRPNEHSHACRAVGEQWAARDGMSAKATERRPNATERRAERTQPIGMRAWDCEGPVVCRCAGICRPWNPAARMNLRTAPPALTGRPCNPPNELANLSPIVCTAYEQPRTRLVDFTRGPSYIYLRATGGTCDPTNGKVRARLAVPTRSSSINYNRGGVMGRMWATNWNEGVAQPSYNCEASLCARVFGHGSRASKLKREPYHHNALQRPAENAAFELDSYDTACPLGGYGLVVVD
ncbi:unnamed protein product [Rhizoctonia solani]|nr:unnamed protein product [Rhizoctonia solani]